MGDVDHAWLHGLIAVVVGVVRLAVLAQRGGGYLAVDGRQREYLAPRGLDGSGLVHVYVAGLRAHDALVRQEHGVDDREVGLGPAGEEVDRGLVPEAAGCADIAAGAVGVHVEPIGQGLIEIGLAQGARVCADARPSA